MTALPLNLTLQTVTDFVGNNSAIQLSTLRLGIRSDSSVTTQVSSVIQATTTNANLVIAPNGTGALVASIPDGTSTGGNARGANAVDLQQSRSGAGQVASSNYSFVGGGQNNSTASGDHYQVVVGGLSNSINASGHSFIGGGQSNSIATGSGSGWSVVTGGRGNVASSQYATVSGGQSNTNSSYGGFIGGGFSNAASNNFQTISGGESNTASTNTHATVVGGRTNASTGQYSVSGGTNNNASGQGAVTIGYGNTGSGAYSVALGIYNAATAVGAVALGGSGSGSAGTGGNNASGIGSFAVGQGSFAYLYGQNSTAAYKFSLNGDAQQSNLTARREASLNSAATTVLSLDGTGTTNLIIPNGNNRLWAVKVVATAFVSVAGGTLVLGDSYMGEFTLLFKRVGGTSSVVGVNAGNIIYDTNMATAAFTFAAGASQDLQITFKAPTTASATTFRCVAKVELVEVAY
jgi:hypothetical protein